MAIQLEHTKIREILFDALHPNPQQAQTAAQHLSNLDGIARLQVGGPCQLFVHYDVRMITLEIIEAQLIHYGFHLDNSILSKIKRALYYYTESIARNNLTESHCSKDYHRAVFINKYNGSDHGCRDQRPSYWREYK